MRPHRKVTATALYTFTLPHLTIKSGKSSFIISILRLLDLNSGKLILDSHDLATLPRPLIREKITCLTQEPFLFSGNSTSEIICLKFLFSSKIERVLEVHPAKTLSDFFGS